MTTAPRVPAFDAAALGRGGWVVLERGGGLWGVAGGEVRGVGSGAAGLTVRLAGGELAADRVLAVVPHLAVHPVPEALARYWPEAAAGLAVHGDRPLVVVDPRRPPRVLAPSAEAGMQVGGESGDESGSGGAAGVSKS